MIKRNREFVSKDSHLCFRITTIVVMEKITNANPLVSVGVGVGVGISVGSGT